MTREAEVASEGDDLGMPDREEHVRANGRRSGEHGVSRHTRQAFVDQMRIDGTAAESRGIGTTVLRSRDCTNTIDTAGRFGGGSNKWKSPS